MRPAFVEGINRSLDYVSRGIEVGLANLQVHDVFALAFQRSSLIQDFEGGFGPEARHARGQAKLVLGGGGFHAGKGRHYTSGAAGGAAN
jgi:hypothetical protein